MPTGESSQWGAAREVRDRYVNHRGWPMGLAPWPSCPRSRRGFYIPRRTARSERCPCLRWWCQNAGGPMHRRMLFRQVPMPAVVEPKRWRSDASANVVLAHGGSTRTEKSWPRPQAYLTAYRLSCLMRSRVHRGRRRQTLVLAVGTPGLVALLATSESCVGRQTFVLATCYLRSGPQG